MANDSSSPSKKLAPETWRLRFNRLTSPVRMPRVRSPEFKWGSSPVGRKFLQVKNRARSYSVQVSRYQKLGRRTWVVCHRPQTAVFICTIFAIVKQCYMHLFYRQIIFVFVFTSLTSWLFSECFLHAIQQCLLTCLIFLTLDYFCDISHVLDVVNIFLQVLPWYIAYGQFVIDSMTYADTVT